jgi:hypothetical protein
MKRIALILASAALVTLAPSVPAFAQASTAVTVGMPIVSTDGAPVGKVTGIQGANLMVKTDKHEVLLPRSSFTAAGGKLLFGMTQAQLNAEVDKSLAAAQAAVVAGATVKGAAGTPVGTLDAADADYVTITLTSGKKIRTKRDAVRGNADGTVTIGYTAEQLEALVAPKAETATPGQ